MNNYSKLIESHMISFKEVMVMNYKKIGLNETEAMIVILLYEAKKHQSGPISLSTILPYTTLSENDLSKLIVDLLERGFVELEIKDGQESYSLKPTMNKLGSVLENANNGVNVKEESAKLIAYTENGYQRNLTPSELLVIQGWFSENYSVEQMFNAINETISLKKMNLRYADAILANKPVKNNQTIEENPEIQEVLKQINVRCK